VGAHGHAGVNGGGNGLSCIGPPLAGGVGCNCGCGGGGTVCVGLVLAAGVPDCCDCGCGGGGTGSGQMGSIAAAEPDVAAWYWIEETVLPPACARVATMVAPATADWDWWEQRLQRPPRTGNRC
jgi:hypothetical protein